MPVLAGNVSQLQRYNVDDARYPWLFETISTATFDGIALCGEGQSGSAPRTSWGSFYSSRSSRSRFSRTTLIIRIILFVFEGSGKKPYFL